MRNNVARILSGLLLTGLPLYASAAGEADEPAAEAAPETTEAASAPVAEAPAAAAVTEEEASSAILPDGLQSSSLLLHTMQRKEYPDGGAHEFTIYPGIAQLNSKFTSHLGVGALYAYHLHENFAVQVNGSYFYINEQTALTDELMVNGQQAPQAATALTLQWAALGGFEVTPIYGKFAFYEGTMGHFGIVLTGGAGVGGTRVQIQSENSAFGQATFGDTGLKFVGQVGAGLRVRFNESFVLRLEVRDLVYTAKVDKIHGCDRTDLTELAEGRPALNASCDGGQFAAGKSDYRIAEQLVREPSSDVLNNVGVYGGVSYTF